MGSSSRARTRVQHSGMGSRLGRCSQRIQGSKRMKALSAHTLGGSLFSTSLTVFPSLSQPVPSFDEHKDLVGRLWIPQGVCSWLRVLGRWVISKTVDIWKGRSCNSLRSTERTLAFCNWEIIVIFAESNFRWVLGLKPPLPWIFWVLRRLAPFEFSEWVWLVQVKVRLTWEDSWGWKMGLISNRAQSCSPCPGRVTPSWWQMFCHSKNNYRGPAV